MSNTNDLNQDPSGLLENVIKGITSQPLRFVIAIVLLLGGFALRANDLGSNLTLFVLVIAGLAALALVGWYVVEAKQETANADRKRNFRQNSSAGTTYNVDARDQSGAQAFGERATAVQNFGAPAPAPPMRHDLPQRSRKSLEARRASVQKNLDSARRKYNLTSGPQHNELGREIEADEQEIAEIQRQLEQLS